MDLTLDLRPATAKAPVMVEVVRPLNAADKALLNQQPTAVRNGTQLRRIRDSHHKLAKLIADGLAPAEVSMITGYSPNRIYVLSNDPTFRELVSFYRDNKVEEYKDFHTRMAAFGTDALQELHQRLDEAPEAMDSDFLMSVVKTMADRTGHAPVSKSVNVNVNANLADRLTRARQRADAVEEAGTSAAPLLELSPVGKEPVA